MSEVNSNVKIFTGEIDQNGKEQWLLGQDHCCEANRITENYSETNAETKETQQKVQEKFEMFWDSLARFKREVEGQGDIKILTRDPVGQFIEWIAVYPADRRGPAISVENQNIVTSLGKLRKSISL